MKITKAKIKNRSLDVEYNEKKTLINQEGKPVESSRDVAAKYYDICHDSLINAFDQLKPHAVLIADLRDAIKVEDQLANGLSFYELDLEVLKNISISGIVITGSDEDGSEAAMIIFQKKTGNRTLNITTPAVKFDDEEYGFSHEFSEVIQNCVEEVEAYMGGKVAVKQLEMNFDEGFEQESTIADEPKKKKTRKMKLGGVDVEVSSVEQQEVA